MPELSHAAEELIRRHPKAVVHMRRQKDSGRFGLVLGSGVGTDLRFPDWKELIEKVARHPAVDGSAILKSAREDNQASITEVLFHHFAEKRSRAEPEEARRRSDVFERETRIEW